MLRRYHDRGTWSDRWTTWKQRLKKVVWYSVESMSPPPKTQQSIKWHQIARTHRYLSTGGKKPTRNAKECRTKIPGLALCLMVSFYAHAPSFHKVLSKSFWQLLHNPADNQPTSQTASQTDRHTSRLWWRWWNRITGKHCTKRGLTQFKRKNI